MWGGFTLLALALLLVKGVGVEDAAWLGLAGVVWIWAGAFVTCHPTRGTFALELATRQAAARFKPAILFIVSPLPVLTLVGITIAPGHRPPRAFLAA